MPNIIKLFKGGFLRVNTEKKFYAVKAGQAWATKDGSPEDYILGPGSILPQGALLLEALSEELTLVLGTGALTLPESPRMQTKPIYNSPKRAIF